MSGKKLILMKKEHTKFIDSMCFLRFPLRKLSGAFGLTAMKGWYRHYFNTEENLNYVGSIPDTSYYGIDEMSVGERAEFLEWHHSQRSVVFDNKHVQEAYCQIDVTVLRQACQVFRREFLQVGNIDVFQESVTIASACNKILRKFFEAGHYRIDSYWWLFGQRQLQQKSADVACLQRTALRLPNNAR